MNISIYAIILNFIKCNLFYSITLVEVSIKIMINDLFKERKHIHKKKRKKNIYIHIYIIYRFGKIIKKYTHDIPYTYILHQIVYFDFYLNISEG